MEVAAERSETVGIELSPAPTPLRNPPGLIGPMSSDWTAGHAASAAPRSGRARMSAIAESQRACLDPVQQYLSTQVYLPPQARRWKKSLIAGFVASLGERPLAAATA